MIIISEDIINDNNIFNVKYFSYFTRMRSNVLSIQGAYICIFIIIKILYLDGCQIVFFISHILVSKPIYL